MFPPARLLILLFCSVHTASSSYINPLDGTSFTDGVITTLWALEPGDPTELDSSFVVELVNVGPNDSTSIIEDAVTVTPGQMSTGTIELQAIATGGHRLLLTDDGIIFTDGVLFEVTEDELDPVVSLAPTATASNPISPGRSTSSVLASSSTSSSSTPSSTSASLSTSVPSDPAIASNAASPGNSQSTTQFGINPEVTTQSGTNFGGTTVSNGASFSTSSTTGSDEITKQSEISTTTSEPATTGGILISTTSVTSVTTVLPQVSRITRHGSVDVGHVVGGVIGGIVACAAVLVLIFVVRRRLRRQRPLQLLDNSDELITPYLQNSSLPSTLGVTAGSSQHPRRASKWMSELMVRNSVQSTVDNPPEQQSSTTIAQRVHIDSGVRLPPPSDIGIPPVYTEG